MTVNFFVLLVLTNLNSNNNFYYLFKQILVKNYTLTVLKISAFYLLGYVTHCLSCLTDVKCTM